MPLAYAHKPLREKDGQRFWRLGLSHHGAASGVCLMQERIVPPFVSSAYFSLPFKILLILKFY